MIDNALIHIFGIEQVTNVDCEFQQVDHPP